MFNGLNRQKRVLALNFLASWFRDHAFSRSVGGSATPAAMNALRACPST